MEEKKKNSIAGVIFIVFIVLVMLIVIISKVVKGLGGDAGGGSNKAKSVDELVKRVSYRENTPVKGSVDLSASSLYDELPNIKKYPLTLEDTSGDIDIEVFSSPEKAGKDADSWLIDMAKAYNAEKHTVDGKTVSVSIRSISSGIAADYIISGKYVPTGYTPSSELWGSYIDAQGGKVSVVEKKLVGNVAGFLVNKDSGYTDYKEVVAAVQDGKLNVGYTNPQASTTGMNLLMTILSDGGDGNISSAEAVNAFSSFQKNIPYVATNTMQMRDSSASGSLDGMTMEYQSYIQDTELQNSYDFIPFGTRHDNPMYYCSDSGAGSDAKKALENFSKYLKDSDAQEAATNKGFNNNADYGSNKVITGKDVKTALDVYKKEKDSGHDIIAVFVADVSGSMAGIPLAQLKESVSNGAKYINENNYVGLVSYSSDVTIEVPIAQMDLNQRAYFQGALDNLQASGNTASYDALVVALKMIEDKKKDVPNAKVMIFLLSDGMANSGYTLEKVTPTIQKLKYPVYTISYGSEADQDEMKAVSEVNEAASIVADSDDIVYQLKSLFNSNL
ncbi:MAG: VWA domain-containing protein [Lachnospiraceae bacterium]|nr:VWA domain-containing protein [Lachnospiraceae bacterium]